MNAADMATLTASIERSLRNCSLNHPDADAFAAMSPPSSDSDRHRFRIPSPVISSSSSSSSSSDAAAAATFVDLNSHVSLPYHWEQCLDLKTGEVYYVNWSSGKKSKEDPRLASSTRKAYSGENVNYCSEEEEDGEINGEESYESEGSSSTGHSSLSSLENYRVVSGNADNLEEDVLVVAGCKGCLMYYMVPKHVEECPKCSAQLLHFNRPDEGADP